MLFGIFKDKSLDRAERVQLLISFFLRASIIFAVARAIWDKQWLTMFISAGILLLTFLPALIERNHLIYLPIEFEFILTFFIYSSLFLGEVYSFFFRFWWWDLFLHFLSSILFGFMGFLIVYILNYEKKVRLKMSPAFVAVFSFAFSLTIAVIWEIFEFLMDYFFAMNMQKSGLIDTMSDLIVTVIGALIISIVGYFYVKNKHAPLLSRLVTKFIKENPKLTNK